MFASGLVGVVAAHATGQQNVGLVVAATAASTRLLQSGEEGIRALGNLGPQLLGLGAFDLAQRVRVELTNAEPTRLAVARLLTEGERARLAE